MDPVTGIGLAASVIQLVMFGIDAAKTCQELYQKGSVTEYNTVDYTTAHLANLTNSLKQSLQNAGTQSPALTQKEKDLVKLAQKCEDCANTLQTELHKLQIQPRASTVEAVRTAVRSIWKKSIIDKILRQLEECRSTLEISLLLLLSQRFDAHHLQSEKSLASLDSNLQLIVTCLANSQTSLTTLVIQKSEETRHITNTQIDRIEKLHIDDRRYEEILNSLFYPDISSRQKQVDSQFDGIENTYNWIFDEPRMRRLGSSNEGLSRRRAPRTKVRWDDFARWLKSEHGVYWINGKAGSGKSTLMNYICTHERRLELLREWCPTRRLLTPLFFFWNSGTRLQKTIHGLLRSLVYQMLKECRELIGCFDNSPLHTWTQSRLSAIFLKLLRQSQVPVAICLFIDGLDEFDGPGDTVIDMITELTDQTNVKVCVSSRPEVAFERAFRGKPSLRLQDLTYESIREYAKLKLSKPVQERASLDERDAYLVESLIDGIGRRAGGVFLWAIVVIRNVREGLEGIADLHELARTIGELPPEVENLFIFMLDRIKPMFKRDAAHFLQIVLYQHGRHEDYVDLCRLQLSHSQRGLADTPFIYEEIVTSELITACRTLKTRLLSHTAGLLELTHVDWRSGRIYGRDQAPDPNLATSVNFVHRTVRDFLLHNDKGSSFLAINGSNEAQVHLAIGRGTLAQLAYLSSKITTSDEYLINPVLDPFRAVLEHISLAERFLGVAQSKLMRSLDYESLARGYSVGKLSVIVIPFLACIMNEGGRLGSSIDLIGLAASEEMTLYVCEQLGLSREARSYPCTIPDLKTYSKNNKNRSPIATLSWNGLNESRRDSHVSIGIRLRSKDYRQALAEYLQWKADALLDPQMAAPSSEIPLVESYMLSCCIPPCLDLVRILLWAGADPMVRIDLSVKKNDSCLEESFWHRWLEYLNGNFHDDMDAHRISSDVLLDHTDTEVQSTFQDVFETTKALLIRGADINHQIEEHLSPLRCLKRRGFRQDRFPMTISPSAMFILEECFNTEPEFRKFMIAVDPLITKPTRKIIGIELGFVWSEETLRRYRRLRANPSAKESAKLLFLIETWEDTGYRRDLDAVQTAFEGVWRSRFPDVELREDTGPSDNNDEEQDDDDDEDNVSSRA